MTTEWEAMVKERSERLQAAHVRRSVRRGMWSELGLSWADCGPLGDICLGMAYLTADEVRAFDAELDRRCSERRQPEEVDHRPIREEL